jgi:rod shape-determining protein MreD
VIALDALKAAVLLTVAALLQVSIATQIEVVEGHPDLVLALLVSLALLRGPLFGACAGFWVGLILDTASFETLGLSSLLLTIVGYGAGRFGEATSRSSAHPPLVAVVLATIGVACGSAVLHFMLGSTIPASQFFVGVLLPSLALNMLLAYPAYRLARWLFPVETRSRGAVTAVG